MADPQTTDATQSWLNTTSVGYRLSFDGAVELGRDLAVAHQAGLIAFRCEGRTIDGGEATGRRWINVDIVRVE